VFRRLLTVVRYPAVGAAGGGDLRDAPPAGGAGPFPLIVFGHGFAVTPAIYSRLLRSWTSAGYVVAAPVFPLGNARALGAPQESDLPNQPADMSFVISRLLEASKAPTGAFAGLIDRSAVAVAGQSDGGDTALAAAYDPRVRDRRVKAAVILSGAEIPSLGAFTFPRDAPALLATQGTADTVNLPSETASFFAAARDPKYLLRLLGAEHLAPYTTASPQLSVVERVTLAFLDGYLEHRRLELRRLRALGDVGSIARIDMRP
jgi:dienelactone hydrolase